MLVWLTLVNILFVYGGRARPPCQRAAEWLETPAVGHDHVDKMSLLSYHGYFPLNEANIRRLHSGTQDADVHFTVELCKTEFPFAYINFLRIHHAGRTELHKLWTREDFKSKGGLVSWRNEYWSLNLLVSRLQQIQKDDRPEGWQADYISALNSVVRKLEDLMNTACSNAKFLATIDRASSMLEADFKEKLLQLLLEEVNLKSTEGQLGVVSYLRQDVIPYISTTLERRGGFCLGGVNIDDLPNIGQVIADVAMGNETLMIIDNRHDLSALEAIPHRQSAGDELLITRFLYSVKSDDSIARFLGFRGAGAFGGMHLACPFMRMLDEKRSFDKFEAFSSFPTSYDPKSCKAVQIGFVNNYVRMAATAALSLAGISEAQMNLSIENCSRTPAFRVLSIGLGVGELHRFITAKIPCAEVTSVELKEEVVDAAYRWFDRTATACCIARPNDSIDNCEKSGLGLCLASNNSEVHDVRTVAQCPASCRSRIVIEDGWAFLDEVSKESQSLFDVVVIDAFDSIASAWSAVPGRDVSNYDIERVSSVEAVSKVKLALAARGNNDLQVPIVMFHIHNDGGYSKYFHQIQDTFGRDNLAVFRYNNLNSIIVATHDGFRFPTGDANSDERWHPCDDLLDFTSHVSRFSLKLGHRTGDSFTSRYTLDCDSVEDKANDS